MAFISFPHTCAAEEPSYLFKMSTELGEAKSMKFLSYEVHDSVTPSPVPEDSFRNRYPSSRKPHRTLTDIICCSRRRHQIHPANTSRRTSPPSPASNYSDHNDKSSSWVLDPQGKFLQQWNKIFLISCLVTAAIDPLFFYIPYIDEQHNCLALNDHLKIAACILRTLTDLFYLIHIILQFRTGFISPHSRVFGRGELVKDSGAIARRYMSSYFWVDVLAVAPLPQVAFWFIIPNMKATEPDAKTTMLKNLFVWQLVPRLIRITPIYKEVTRISGIITQTAWVGAAFNLYIYVIASHTVGALWYCFALSREEDCWRYSCRKHHNCNLTSLYCVDHTSRSNINNMFQWKECLIDPDQISGSSNSSTFNYGIFQDAVSNISQSTNFLDKLFYCFWWGLRNLSSQGQNLHPSSYFIENLLSVIICILGLVLFALLIGNMQKYLQSTTVRVEEMRVRRQDAEQWMSHRLLPHDLRKSIRRYEEYRWQVTKGVDEESLIRSLPRDLRRDIKRHVCLPLLNGVAMLSKMDEQLKDAMCYLLKPVLYTKDRLVFREGDPVGNMVFIMRGQLMTTTTNGGQTGFFNLEYLKQGDFFGEELLTWALNPHSSQLPTSTRTVSSLSDIEAFSISPDDIKFIAAQYRRGLNSKQLRRAFRSQSQQWRTWAACFIQAAWHQFTKKKLKKALKAEEDAEHKAALAKEKGRSPKSLKATFYSSRFAANDLRNLTVRECLNRSATAPKTLPSLLRLQKPAEPDFSSDDE